MPTGIKITDEQVQYVLQNYADKSNPELMAEVGLSKSSIDRLALVHHLRKSKEHLHRMGVKAGRASNESRGGKALNITKEVIEKRVATYKETVRREKARVLFGLEQKTKIRVKVQPHLKCNQRSYLKKLGYIIDDKEMIAYYTPETHRAKRMEATPCGRKTNKIKQYYEFKPYEERRMD